MASGSSGRALVPVQLPMSDGSVRTWREQAGISDAVTSHSLRHTFAQGIYERTNDVLLVKKALGHRSIASSLVYAHASEERLRAAIGG